MISRLCSPFTDEWRRTGWDATIAVDSSWFHAPTILDLASISADTRSTDYFSFLFAPFTRRLQRVLRDPTRWYPLEHRHGARLYSRLDIYRRSSAGIYWIVSTETFLSFFFFSFRVYFGCRSNEIWNIIGISLIFKVIRLLSFSRRRVMKLKKKKGKEKLTIRWKYRKIGMHNFLNFSKILATLFVSAIHVLNRSRSII